MDDDENQLSARPIELSGISDLMLSNYQELERLYSGAYNGSSNAGFHWEDGDRVSTGITDLDVMTGGMRQREITLIAGDNASGATALALNIAANSALFTDRSENEGNRVALFSLFHTEEDLSMHMLSTIAGVNLELMHLMSIINFPASFRI
ncbi:MAG: DnaB-like helicase C-terminal domain-containing protein [Mariprofundaceae bacterium]